MNPANHPPKRIQEPSEHGVPNPEAIIEALRSLPEVDPPRDFRQKVMAALTPMRLHLFQRLRFACMRPVSLTFVPVRWIPAAALGLLLIVWIPLQHQSDNPPNLKNETAELNYIMGRSRLAQNDPRAALPYLKAAANLDPGQRDYHFWLGVAYWALNDYQKERDSYRQALKLDPEHLPSRVYLGHSFMDRGQWRKALDQYQQVLPRAPENRELLFNTALAYRNLGLREQENATWERFLSHQSSGERAMGAVEYLHANGIFSFQPVLLGGEEAVLPSISFKSQRVEAADDTLDGLRRTGQIISQKPVLMLNIVVYVKGNESLAKARAQWLKGYLLSHFPQLSSRRIRLSWFDVPRKIAVEDHSVLLDESVQMFAVSQSNS